MLKTILVLLATSYGNITLELYPEKAPKTVHNFVEYVNEGHYNGTMFHRVIDDFMIQGGGFTADMQQKKMHPPIKNEAGNGLKNERGTIAMARTGNPHSATAQFFINTADNAPLNHTGKTQEGWGYTVFGRVIEGMDVVDRIGNTPTSMRIIQGYPAQDVPQTTILIQEARVLKGGVATKDIKKAAAGTVAEKAVGVSGTP